MHPTSGLLGHAGRKEQRDLGLYLIHRIGVSGRFIIKTAVCCCVQSLCPKLRQHDMQVLVHLAVRLERKGTTFFRFIQKAWWHRSTTTLLYSAPSSLSTRYEQQHTSRCFSSRSLRLEGTTISLRIPDQPCSLPLEQRLCNRILPYWNVSIRITGKTTSALGFDGSVTQEEQEQDLRILVAAIVSARRYGNRTVSCWCFGPLRSVQVTTSHPYSSAPSRSSRNDQQQDLRIPDRVVVHVGRKTNRLDTPCCNQLLRTVNSNNTSVSTHPTL